MMEKYESLCEEAARKWDVSSQVHPEDFIFQFVIEHAGFESEEIGVQHYFDDGAKSARRLRSLLTDVCGLNVDEPFRLLEFASGYGCVSRHLSGVMPACDVVACDIHQQAIDFVQDELGVKTALSESCPEDLRFEQSFNAIFALSFFSHMPKRTFTRWLHQLASLLEPGGFLIFTTHGLVSRERFFGHCPLDADGFHFRSLTEQKDISDEDYGATTVHPRYVMQEIFKALDLVLKYYQEALWWEHQDLFIVQKRPGHGLYQVTPGPTLRARIRKTFTDR